MHTQLQYFSMITMIEVNFTQVRMSEEPLNFCLFKLELRERVQIERYVAFKNNKSDDFNKE